MFRARSIAFVDAALIRRGRLLEGGAYKICLASGGAYLREALI